jgi:hypothetical protein
MSNTSGRGEQGLQDPELLLCQVKIKDLCDEILAHKPEQSPLTNWYIRTTADGNVVQDKLRTSSLGDLLLKDGDTLSMPGGHERYPDIGLYVGRVALTKVGVRAWGWEDDKYRIDPNGPNKPPYDIIIYPGEKDWTRQLDISLHYSDGSQAASQTITAQTGSTSAGHAPSVSRSVFALAYAESGYERHNQVWRSARNSEEIEDFVSLVRNLLKFAA